MKWIPRTENEGQLFFSKFRKNAREQKAAQGKNYYMPTLALDPSGTTETGYFLFRSIQDWEIGTILGKNAIEQAKNLDILLKKARPQVLAWETSVKLSMEWTQRDYRELLRFEGIIAYLTSINDIHRYEIMNREVKSLIKHYGGEIGGLEVEKKQWKFKGQLITVHQRDAILVFFLYWTRKLKRPWPWI